MEELSRAIVLDTPRSTDQRGDSVPGDQGWQPLVGCISLAMAD